jgi:hypothetical protein
MLEALLHQLFEKHWGWLHADHWDHDTQLKFPGVYLLAYSDKGLDGQKVEVADVFYVGMSNSKGGVRARLDQFKSAIEGRRGHSAGNYCYQRNGQKPFSELRTQKKFYFAACCLELALRQRVGSDPVGWDELRDVLGGLNGHRRGS